MEKSRKSERIIWIDIAKALGCILVIIGHFWYRAPHPKINTLIYSFHIPLFFICSGFIFKIKQNVRFLDNIKTKFKRIMIPSIFFILFGVLMKFVLGEVTSYLELFKQTIFWTGRLPFNVPVWFFIVLFEVYVMIYLFLLVSKNKLNDISVTTLTIMSFIIGYIVYRYNIFIPFGLNRALLCFGYFTSGILIKRICNKFNNNNLLLGILLVISTASWLLVALINKKISIYGYIFNNYWLLVLSGILGTISLLIVSYFMSHIKLMKLLTIISSMSVFLMGTHFILEYHLERLVRPIWYSELYVLYTIAMTILIIIIYIPICKFLDKYIPFLTGKAKSNT